jgi:hypothetical protein
LVFEGAAIKLNVSPAFCQHQTDREIAVNEQIEANKLAVHKAQKEESFATTHLGTAGRV